MVLGLGSLLAPSQNTRKMYDSIKSQSSETPRQKNFKKTILNSILLGGASFASYQILKSNLPDPSHIASYARDAFEYAADFLNVDTRFGSSLEKGISTYGHDVLKQIGGAVAIGVPTFYLANKIPSINRLKAKGKAAVAAGVLAFGLAAFNPQTTMNVARTTIDGAVTFVDNVTRKFELEDIVKPESTTDEIVEPEIRISGDLGKRLRSDPKGEIRRVESKFYNKFKPEGDWHKGLKDALKRSNRKYNGIPQLAIAQHEFEKAGADPKRVFTFFHESHWKNRVVSPKKAAGIGQIMPDTARKRGGHVTYMYDVRLHPVLASQISGEEFAHLERDFKSNPELVPLAYNGGNIPYNYRKVVKEKRGTMNLAGYFAFQGGRWLRSKNLPKKTAKAIRRGIKENTNYHGKEYAVQRVAKEQGWYEDVSPQHHGLSIYTTKEGSFKTVRVKSGDSLTKIADRNGVYVSDIDNANWRKIKNKDRILAGWRLKIPHGGETFNQIAEKLGYSNDKLNSLKEFNPHVNPYRKEGGYDKPLPKGAKIFYKPLNPS